MTPTLHVGVGIDGPFAPHAAVTIASVLRTHPAHAVEVHVLHTGMDESIAEALRSLADGASRHRVHLRAMDEADIGLKAFARFTSAVHLRFHLPALVPERGARLLYLDSDTVVVDDLSPLWRLELGDATAAAVEDDTAPLQLERLAGRGLATYLNSGVILVDVDRWRARDATARLLEGIAAQEESLAMPDQDGLNLILRDELAVLPRRWNVQRPTFFEGRRTLGLAAAEHRALLRRPGIVHFTDFSKPWDASDQHPLGHLYRSLRELGPFADPALEAGRSLRTRLSTAGKRLLQRVSPEILPWLRERRGRPTPLAAARRGGA